MLPVEKIYRRVGGNKGVTLVELIVAAVVLIVAIVALMAVVRTMRGEKDMDYHRRQARAIVVRTFENTFAYTFFPGPYNLPTDGETVAYASEFIEAGVDPDEELTKTQTGVSAAKPNDEAWVRKLRIDSREGQIPLIGTMRIELRHDPQTIGGGAIPAGAISKTIDTHLITITVEWTELDGTKDTIKLSKRLAATI